MIGSKNSWEVVNAVVNSARLLLLYGPPGTGKTHAALQGREDVYSVTVTPETPAAELRGHYVPRGGEFVWQDGPAIRAWREGARLVVNEINHAGGDLVALLLGLLDNRESARLTLPSGETVRPAPGFSCVATMNGRPADLLEALRDRFAVNVEIHEPHPAAFDGLPPELRNAARGTVTDADEDARITLRAWLAYADLVKHGVDREHAASAVFGRRAGDVLASLAIAE
jgi:MoxR-like ATPase